MNNRELLKSTIVALGCYSILTLVLPGGEGSDISPTDVTVDTRGWFHPDVTITMHRVAGYALENGGSDAGIDEALRVKGSDQGVLARQPQLPIGSPFAPPVSGLIADGVTPLLFRVSAGGGLTGQVTYDVKLEVSNSLWASCPDLSGRLKVLQEGAWIAGSKVTLSPQQPEAYLVLEPVAPSEIKSNTAILRDSSLGMVQFILSLKHEGAFRGSKNDVEIEFGVRKPPVVLVHGFNSDSSAWSPSFESSLMSDRGASFVVAVNYGTDNGNYQNTYGDLLGAFRNPLIC